MTSSMDTFAIATPGYGGNFCGERRDATSVVVSASALLTIAICALIVLCKYSIVIC